MQHKKSLNYNFCNIQTPTLKKCDMKRPTRIFLHDNKIKVIRTRRPILSISNSRYPGRKLIKKKRYVSKHVVQVVLEKELEKWLKDMHEEGQTVTEHDIIMRVYEMLQAANEIPTYELDSTSEDDGETTTHMTQSPSDSSIQSNDSINENQLEITDQSNNYPPHIRQVVEWLKRFLQLHPDLQLLTKLNITNCHHKTQDVCECNLKRHEEMELKYIVHDSPSSLQTTENLSSSSQNNDSPTPTEDSPTPSITESTDQSPTNRASNKTKREDRSSQSSTSSTSRTKSNARRSKRSNKHRRRANRSSSSKITNPPKENWIPLSYNYPFRSSHPWATTEEGGTISLEVERRFLELEILRCEVDSLRVRLCVARVLARKTLMESGMTPDAVDAALNSAVRNV